MLQFRFFPDVSDVVKYQGPDSTNPFAFKFYDPARVVAGKTMSEHLKGSLAAWHFLGGGGRDPFGDATARLTWPLVPANWDDVQTRLDALGEAMNILGLNYTFHDFDLVMQGRNWKESKENLDRLGKMLVKMQAATGRKCSWTTQNHFSDPRYMVGAGTSCEFNSWAFAGAQVKAALDLGKELDADGHVFWGGREGPSSMLTYDLGAALDRRAAALHGAVEYKRKIGFRGDFRIEPKPKEPTSVQLDSDVGSCWAFLCHYGLQDDFNFNLEFNHATLAGKPFAFELAYARHLKRLGSVDANEGDTLLGWDTDHTPRVAHEAALAFVEILRNGGLKTGGLNFDAKVRRNSVEPSDRIVAHVVALDAYGWGLMAADILLRETALSQILDRRHASWKSNSLALRVGKGEKVTLEELDQFVLDQPAIPPVPSEQEEECHGLLNFALAQAVRRL